MTEWIVSSAVLIVVITIVRQLLKGKISLQLQYALWAIVLVRLLVPVSFGQTKISVQNVVQAEQTVHTEQGELAETPGITIDIPPSRVDYVAPDLSVVEPDPNLPEEEREQQYEQNVQQWQDELDADWEEYKAENTRHVTLSVTDVLYLVWIAGMAVTVLIFALSNLRIRLRLRRSRRPLEAVSRLPVYLTGAVETPCLFGLFRPAVYVTPEVAEDEVALGHVLAHEETHCSHGDHVWALLRCLCLVIHWYNPLVWLAAALSRRDAELACDAGTIRRIGEGECAAYGSTLIGLTCAHRGNLLHTATTMTGSKKSIKERIVLIAKKPKMAVYTLIAVILIAAVAVGCTFTGREYEAEEGFVKWAQSLRVEDMDDVYINLLGKQYTLNESESNELLAILQTVVEEDFAGDDPEVEKLTGVLIVNLGGESPVEQFSFGRLTDGTVRITCTGDRPREKYDFEEPLRLDCPELYEFITKTFGSYARAEIQEYMSGEVLDYAEGIMEKYVSLHADVPGRSEECWAELMSLSEVCAVPSLDYVLGICRLEFDLFMGQDGAAVSGSRYVRYFGVYLDYSTDGYVCFGELTDELIAERYNTSEMLEKYGYVYFAAAMELFQAHFDYAPGEPGVAFLSGPDVALQTLAAGSDVLTMTLFDRETIATHSIYLQVSDTGDYMDFLNLLTEHDWVSVELPTPPSDYRVTLSNGEGTLTFYSGSRGLVEYTCGNVSRTWMSGSGTWDGDSQYANEIREIYLKLESFSQMSEQVYDAPLEVLNYARMVGYLETTFGHDDDGMEITSLTKLENMNSGVAGNDFAVDVYRATFVSISEMNDVMGTSIHLVVLWQNSSEPSFIPLGYTRFGTEIGHFNTEEMLQKYGSPYTAMAEGFYDAYLVRSGERSEYPATPGQALEQLCSDGGALSVGHHWRRYGDAEETKADPAETLAVLRPYFDGILWVKLDFAPEIDDAYNFTFTSADGGETLRVLWDSRLIEYSSGGDYVYWIAADDRYYEVAEPAMDVYFNNLYKAKVAETEGAVRYGFYSFNYDGKASQLIIETGNSEEERVYHFYGMVQGLLTEIATVNGAYSYLANGEHEYGEEDLVLAGAHDGEEWAYRLTWGGYKEAKAEVRLIYRWEVDGENDTEWPDRIEMYDANEEWSHRELTYQWY